MKLSAIVAALKNRGISEEVAKSAVIDIEDHDDASGLGGGRQTGIETAPGRGAHGFDAMRQVGMSSDLAPQGVRQNEYQALAGMLSEQGASMKSIAEALKALAPKAPEVTAKAGEDTALGQFAKVLKMAKSAVFKAEMDDKDEDEEDPVEKAEKLLVKAKKLLAKAEEDDEDGKDEDKVEKAQSDLRKVAKSLKSIKDERAAVVKAAADAETARVTAEKATADAEATRLATEKAAADAVAAGTVAKTEAEKSAEAVSAVKGKVEMLTASMGEIVNLIGNLSRSGGVPPDLTVAKGATAEVAAEPSYATRIMEMQEAGQLNLTEGLKAKVIASHLGLVKSGDAELSKVQAEIREAPDNVKKLFAPILAKTAA